MRKLYLFVNSSTMKDWLNCLSMTDDGYILGNHICSHMDYMKYDLHDRPKRLEKIKSHYKDEPYEIEILSYKECKNNSEFLKAVKIAESKDQSFEKAGAVIEFS